MTNSKLKDSNIEWLGKIPSNWNLIKGKYLFTLRTTKGNTKQVELLSPTQEYGVIPQKLYEKLTGMRPVKLKSNTDLNQMKSIYKGDFYISLRSFQGGFEYSNYDGIVSPAYQVFYPSKQVNRNYFKYLFKDKSFIQKLNSYTMSLRDGKNIAFSDFGNTYLPFPALDEQNKIADFLDKKVSQIDDISKKIQQEITDLEEYRKSIITKAVTKGIDKNVPIKNSGDKMIGEIAASFKLVPLKYVANYNLHTLSDDTNPDFCFKYIDIGSVTTGHINKYQKLRFADAPSRARRLVKNNDIIISTVRTYLKAIAFIQDLQKTTVVSTGFIVLSPKKNLIDPVYLRYAIENESFISKVQAYSVGITYPAINSSTIMNFKLVYPPFNAQKEIASYLDKKCKSINQIIEKKRTLINSLNQYKQSIIYEYVTGKKQVSSEEGVQE